MRVRNFSRRRKAYHRSTVKVAWSRMWNRISPMIGPSGCGMAAREPLRLLRRTLAGYARHPNFSRRLDDDSRKVLGRHGQGRKHEHGRGGEVRRACDGEGLRVHGHVGLRSGLGDWPSRRKGDNGSRKVGTCTGATTSILVYRGVRRHELVSESRSAITTMSVPAGEIGRHAEGSACSSPGTTKSRSRRRLQPNLTRSGTQPGRRTERGGRARVSAPTARLQPASARSPLR